MKVNVICISSINHAHKVTSIFYKMYGLEVVENPNLVSKMFGGHKSKDIGV